MHQQNNSSGIDHEQVLASCEYLFSSLSSSLHSLETQLTELVPRIQQPGIDARRAAAIITALPAGVVIIDGAGLISQCNPAAEDLLGIPLTGQPWLGIIERAFAPRADDGHDISLVDGRIVNISTSPLGDVPGQLVLITDVSKTRNLQTQISRNDRLVAMGQMTANMAHQIRTPLSAALLYASQLKNARLGQTQLHRVAERITSSIHHLEHLVNDMLMYANGGTAGEGVFPVSDFISELEQAIQLQLTDSAIEFNVNNEVPGAELKANRDMLFSCMQNLANNAIEAMGGIGLLTLHARQTASGGVDLMIEDTGPGISTENQEHIFEPFFTTRAKGTGLGLAVVKLIANAHHGDAWFHSVPGKGSTFAMRLPVLQFTSTSRWLPQNMAGAVAAAR